MIVAKNLDQNVAASPGSDISSSFAAKLHRSFVATAAGCYLPQMLAFNLSRNQLMLSEFELRSLSSMVRVVTNSETTPDGHDEVRREPWFEVSGFMWSLGEEAQSRSGYDPLLPGPGNPVRDAR